MNTNQLKLTSLLALAATMPVFSQDVLQRFDPCDDHYDHYDFNTLIGPSEWEIEYERDYVCEVGPESGVTTATANRMAGLTATRVNTRDVGDRLFRKRAGVPNHSTTTTTPAPAPVSAKGGMAKGGMAKEPIVVTTPAKWEIYGGLFGYTEDSDPQFVLIRPAVPPGQTAPPPAPIQVLTAGDTEFNLWGGHVGIERRINNNFSFGLAFSGSEGEAESSIFGTRLSTTDVTSLSLIPYISYYRDNAVFGADYWADLMYAYTDQSYDIQRNNFGLLAGGSPDGSTHTVDFNTGLTFRGTRISHGPYAGIRWIDGEIDGYQEFGPGGGALFPSQDIESLATTLGYSVSGNFAGGGGTWVPQLRAAWEHEFEDNTGNVFGFPLGTVDEDLAVLGAGIGYYANSGWNAVLDYEARLGSEVQGHYVGLKVGKEF
ncbi:autotransporter outer membrane beta-barrel domain-containing protein [Haloferula rosea]|uniref:Autotransporter outer membrane beta-barrel domain-containing protein n=1 Tax=Haloferula rosea TaxID=490093 RepID=A0A934RCJ4_9BACT|nr:autotransporter outer membrane beta-barrel domain-containing protein [Haloferula rosea]MBK1827233.1 autotransporter outer membrane beta-barrel domain-containing protein [Haloferula rosea]